MREVLECFDERRLWYCWMKVKNLEDQRLSLDVVHAVMPPECLVLPNVYVAVEKWGHFVSHLEYLIVQL